MVASCGGTQTAGEQAQTPETKTAVKHGPEIALLKPDPKSGMTVNEALQNRRSSREYAPEALSLEELSGVMWAAGGINRPQDGRLTAPSALALYPIRIYAFFPEGVYRYDAKGQKLVRVAEGDRRSVAGAQPFVFTAPLNLAYVADMSVYEGKNIPAGHVRYLCGQDAAGYAENVNLYTAGHGLKSITRGSAPEAELLETLGLDPGRYFLALVQTVGKSRCAPGMEKGRLLGRPFFICPQMRLRPVGWRAPALVRSRPFARVVPGAFPGVVLKTVSGCSVLSLPKASPLPHPGRRVPPAGRYRIRVPVSTPRRKVFPHRGIPPAGGGAGATACPCRCVRVRLP